VATRRVRFGRCPEDGQLSTGGDKLFANKSRQSLRLNR
jgi:hypothetical protein